MRCENLSSLAHAPPSLPWIGEDPAPRHATCGGGPFYSHHPSPQEVASWSRPSRTGSTSSASTVSSSVPARASGSSLWSGQDEARLLHHPRPRTFLGAPTSYTCHASRHASAAPQRDPWRPLTRPQIHVTHEIAHEHPRTPTNTPPPDRIPNAALRKKFLAQRNDPGGYTATGLAKECGWVVHNQGRWGKTTQGDSRRVTRALGITPETQRRSKRHPLPEGQDPDPQDRVRYFNQNISYEKALKIAEVLGLSPIDVGL